MTFQVEPDLLAVCTHSLRCDRLATTFIRGILLGTRVLHRNVDDLYAFTGRLGTGPFFGEKTHFQGKRLAENMDLSPSRGQGQPDSFAVVRLGLQPSQLSAAADAAQEYLAVVVDDASGKCW